MKSGNSELEFSQHVDNALHRHGAPTTFTMLSDAITQAANAILPKMRKQATEKCVWSDFNSITQRSDAIKLQASSHPAQMQKLRDTQDLLEAE